MVARWLGDLDGWRVDVANMTGRYKDVDVAHDVARAVRATMTAARPDALLLAEHSFDATGDLAGDGWHGAMNYAGFSVPVWQWLRDEPRLPLPHGMYPAIPRLPGANVAAAMRAFAAATPWRAVAHVMNLVSSHDTTRVATRLGDPAHVDVALGLLATYPGIPMIWSGDEIDMAGADGEDGRWPFPWHRPESWDRARLGTVREFFRARAASVALRRGGLRWLAADHDVLVFAREAPGETVVVQASRSSHPPVRLPAAMVGRQLVGLVGADDVTADVTADGDGVFTLPGDGPGVRVWVAG